MKTQLSPHDTKEVAKFQEYLRDMYSEMTAQDFADKYSEYMGTTPEIARTHVVKMRQDRGVRHGDALDRLKCAHCSEMQREDFETDRRRKRLDDYQRPPNWIAFFSWLTVIVSGAVIWGLVLERLFR